jgi:hypothetical protein
VNGEFFGGIGGGGLADIKIDDGGGHADGEREEGRRGTIAVRR